MQANSGDPDQTPQSVASDLGLHYMPMSRKKDSRHIWVKNAIVLLISLALQKFGKYIVEIIFLVKVHLEHLTELIYKYENTLNKTRKRETVSYNKTIGAYFFG